MKTIDMYHLLKKTKGDNKKLEILSKKLKYLITVITQK
jgi:hypothetical protein